eukprot:4975383-Prymnesium_polylepis.1
MSLATARALKVLHVATDDVATDVALEREFAKFPHLRVHTFHQPELPWEDRVEWLKARFVEKHIGKGAV